MLLKLFLKVRDVFNIYIIYLFININIYVENRRDIKSGHPSLYPSLLHIFRSIKIKISPPPSPSPLLPPPTRTFLYNKKVREGGKGGKGPPHPASITYVYVIDEGPLVFYTHKSLYYQ